MPIANGFEQQDAARLCDLKRQGKITLTDNEYSAIDMILFSKDAQEPVSKNCFKELERLKQKFWSLLRS